MNIFYFDECPIKSARAQPLGNEYKFRYGREHASITKLKMSLVRLPAHIKMSYERTPLAQAMPDEYKNDNPIKAYRDYCINEKHYAKWEKGRAKPDWWTKEVA